MKLHAEPFHPTGAMGGEGALKLLGVLELDFWAHVMRETIQNIGDAADPNRSAPVEFLVDLRTYSREEWKPVWEGVFGKSIPPSSDRAAEFPGDWTQLKPSGPRTLLVLADRNTTGMGGPAQADSGKLFDNLVARDFADFIFNLGIPPDHESGGGTYGYGKSVLYRASLASTIIVHTHCTDELGQADSRLMAVGLSGPYEDPDNDQNLTGRHWWGDTDTYPSVGPVRGEEADRLAEAIGFPGFEPGERGTNIAIAVPDLVGDNQAFMEGLQAASLWHCWPKLLTTTGDPEMRFQFALDGEPLPDLQPGDIEGLQPFCDAYRGMEDTDHENTHLIRSQRPRKNLGQLHLRRFPEAEDLPTPTMRPFEGRTQHVAVMRTPNLVVRYYPHLANPIPSQGWAGVFKVLPEMDREFARAEPPAHDAWSRDAATGPEGKRTNFPRIALRNIKTVVADFLSVDLAASQGSGGSLGELSETLGELFSPGGGTGIGGRRDRGHPRPPSPPRTRPAISTSDPRIDRESDHLAHRYPFEIEHVPGARASRLSGHVRVEVIGGTENSPPWGQRGADIVGFEDPDGELNPGATIDIPADHPGGTWKVLVHGPLNAQIRLRLDSEVTPEEED